MSTRLVLMHRNAEMLALGDHFHTQLQDRQMERQCGAFAVATARVVGTAFATQCSCHVKSKRKKRGGSIAIDKPNAHTESCIKHCDQQRTVKKHTIQGFVTAGAAGERAEREDICIMTGSNEKRRRLGAGKILDDEHDRQPQWRIYN